MSVKQSDLISFFRFLILQQDNNAKLTAKTFGRLTASLSDGVQLNSKFIMNTTKFVSFFNFLIISRKDGII